MSGDVGGRLLVIGAQWYAGTGGENAKKALVAFVSTTILTRANFDTC